MAQQPPPPPPPPPPPAQPPGGPVYGGVPAYGARPSGVTAAAVVMFVVGGLRSVLGLIALIAVIGAGGQLSGIPGAGAFIGVAVIIVLITIGAAVLQILGGTHTLRLRRRGRAIGLTGTIIGLAIGVLGLVGGASDGQAGALVVTLLFIIGDVVIIVLLAQNGRYLTNP
jgi:hypothetical protein